MILGLVMILVLRMYHMDILLKKVHMLLQITHRIWQLYLQQELPKYG